MQSTFKDENETRLIAGFSKSIINFQNVQLQTKLKCRIEDTHVSVGIFNHDLPQNRNGQITFISWLDSQNQISYKRAGEDGEVELYEQFLHRLQQNNRAKTTTLTSQNFAFANFPLGF